MPRGTSDRVGTAAGALSISGDRQKAEDAEVKAFCELMKSDRIISILVGKIDDGGADGSGAAFSFQASLLQSLSEYFVKALRNQHLGDQRSPDVLIFPEDNVEAWNVLAYWLIKRHLPHAKLAGSDLLCVRCWILGDKYDIIDFQDEVMRSLLELYERHPVTEGALEEAVTNTLPGSALRMVVAEEAVHKLHYEYSNDEFARNVSNLDGHGFMGALIDAQRKWASMLDKEPGQSPGWSRYLPPDFADISAVYLVRK